MGQTYSSRPSAILGISDSWLAYQVDVAALLLGRRVEAATADGKMTVGEALAAPDTETRGHGDAAIRGHGDTGTRRYGDGQGAKQKWRDPRPYVSKVMAVPESGIW